jgi:hypothetical protein
MLFSKRKTQKDNFLSK